MKVSHVPVLDAAGCSEHDTGSLHISASDPCTMSAIASKRRTHRLRSLLAESVDRRMREVTAEHRLESHQVTTTTDDAFPIRLLVESHRSSPQCEMFGSDCGQVPGSRRFSTKHSEQIFPGVK
jgi:hypothetical protein